MDDSIFTVKFDINQLFPFITTNDLRRLRDTIAEEVKNREREERKNMPPVKPEYRYWQGKVVRRRGNALSRYSFLLEPTDVKDVPQDIIDRHREYYFTPLGGAFKKATCPKIGDVVMLKYRVLKSAPLDTCYRKSRIICVVPPKLAE